MVKNCKWLGLHKRRPSYRRSLQSSNENIQHFQNDLLTTFSFCCESFSPSWIRIRTGNPDRDTYPYSQHCLKVDNKSQFQYLQHRGTVHHRSGWVGISYGWSVVTRAFKQQWFACDRARFIVHRFAWFYTAFLDPDPVAIKSTKIYNFLYFASHLFKPTVLFTNLFGRYSF